MLSKVAILGRRTSRLRPFPKGGVKAPQERMQPFLRAIPAQGMEGQPEKAPREGGYDRGLKNREGRRDHVRTLEG